MQLIFGFDEFRIKRDTVDRTHLLTLRLVKMTDAFRAFRRINLVNFYALIDGAIRALGFANVTVDAFVGDLQRHFSNTPVDEYPARLHARRANPGSRRAARNPRVGVSSFQRCHSLPTLTLSAVTTNGCTKSRTSPPSVAISRTMVAEMNMYLSEGVKNIVSTPGFSLRFMPAI